MSTYAHTCLPSTGSCSQLSIIPAKLNPGLIAGQGLSQQEETCSEQTAEPFLCAASVPWARTQLRDCRVRDAFPAVRAGASFRPDWKVPARRRGSGGMSSWPSVGTVQRAGFCNQPARGLPPALPLPSGDPGPVTHCLGFSVGGSFCVHIPLWFFLRNPVVFVNQDRGHLVQS